MLTPGVPEQRPYVRGVPVFSVWIGDVRRVSGMKARGHAQGPCVITTHGPGQHGGVRTQVVGGEVGFLTSDRHDGKAVSEKGECRYGTRAERLRKDGERMPETEISLRGLPDGGEETKGGIRVTIAWAAGAGRLRAGGGRISRGGGGRSWTHGRNTVVAPMIGRSRNEGQRTRKRPFGRRVRFI